MKPVNLVPAKLEVAKAAAGKPNMGLIGGSIAGVVAVVGIAGYFAMARVDSVKSETAQFTTTASAATTETASVRSQIASLGQPVVDSDMQLAQGAEKVLVGAYTERRDYPLAIREVLAVMQGTGGWYTSIKASSSAGETGKTVTLEGFMPSRESLAALNENLEATKSLKDASTDSLKSVRKFAISGKKRAGVYIQFVVTAQLVDRVPPYVADESAAMPNAATDGTTVSDSGSDLILSLDGFDAVAPSAKPKATVEPAKVEAPKNPFDLAANAATRGSLK